MRIGIFLFVLSFQYLVNDLHAQGLSSIEGTVFDTGTKEFLPGATVYLANTSIGVAANNDGTFLLNNITPGKYDLTVTMIGYKTYSKPIVFEGNAVKGFAVYLNQNVTELNAVEVKAKRESLKNEYFKFEKIFLGGTQNSAKCKIINRHDIFAYREDDKLIASANKPIEIINNALGYRIIYELKDFVFDNTNNIVVISGTPRFENLPPENKKQELKWTRERDRAYYGSMEHFIRALKSKQLKKNRFALYNSDGQEMTEEKLFTNSNDPVIHYKGKLTLIFGGELAESTYDPKRGRQESVLNFMGNSVRIYDNGIYDGYYDILLLGYMGWSSRISEIVPLGYQPYSRLK